MKILLQNSLYWPHMVGGAEQCTLLLAGALRARGHQVSILTTTGKHGSLATLTTTKNDRDETVYQAPSHGLYDLVELKQRPGILVRGLHHYAAVYSPRWFRLAQEALQAAEADILHTNSLVGMTPAVWKAAQRRGIPVVHTLHDFHLLCPRNTLLRSDQSDCEHPPLPCRILAGLKLRATRDVQALAAPSQYHLQKHRDAGGFPRARTWVVPNACDHIPERIPERDVSRGPVRALFLGALEAHKGIEILLQALENLVARNQKDWWIDFAGTGSCAPLVQDFCARHPELARHHGYVSGKAKDDLLRQAHLMLVPSVCQDNAPRTILDAFAWGLAVIGTRRGGIPELVRDGREGLLIQPQVQALEQALLRYQNDRAMLAAQGGAARNRAAEFTLDIHVTKYEEIYRALLDQAPRKA